MQERPSNSNGAHASGVHCSDATRGREARIPSSNAKRELLEKYLSGEMIKDPSSRTISRRDQNSDPQLSFSQERMWFLDQLMPGSPVFNVPIAVPFSGAVDLAILQQCVDEIVRRHEVFRTRFLTVDGKPALVVSSDIDATIATFDLTSIAEAKRSAALQILSQEEARRPFKLDSGPLLRTTLIKLGEQASVFLLTMHHIVSDGWSILIFFRELSALYKRFGIGESSPLDELTIQYADYALWQRRWLCGDVLEQQISYWRDQLGGDLPVLDLPADRPRPVLQTYAGDRVALTLPENLSAALSALSRRAGATLFMTLLAAFKVLLQRYTGQEDIIIGSPIANRPQPESEKLIGFFLNNLALRSDVSGDPDFLQLLAKVRATALDAYANQDVPFERLIEELKPERDLSRTSIFQVYFNLFSFADQIDLPNGESINFVDAWLQSEESLAKFDLTLYAGVGEKEIKLAFLYNTDLFARARVEQMAEQFHHLLSQIVAQPEQKISCYSLVTPATRNLLPDPTRRLTAHKGAAITTLFSRRAERAPNRTAVVDARECVSYQELDWSSNQLANYLRESGIQPGEVVAIYGHRSAPLVCAILAILKAGAAFTILDPAYPAARLVDCLKIATPRAWIQIEAAGALPDTLREFVDDLDLAWRTRLSSCSSQFAEWGHCSTTHPEVEIQSDSLAYIAFTSGSTGQPKGVMGRHGPLTLFTSWAVEQFGLDESDRFCMLSGLAHDPLHRDIFTPLQMGGTICIPDPAELESPPRLRQWMRDQLITVANLTPAMSQLLTEDLATDEQIDSLRYSFLVGDVLTKHDVARLGQLAPTITCVNLYGSTETQRAVGHYIVPSDQAGPAATEKQVLPLGKGIKDTQLLVLNRLGQLCGVGEAGEIYFRSPHLAKGYLGDPTLTAERFIRNPFTTAEDDRLYRTGDLGRYLPDGNVEHLGRADRQIKIRGFRIEPREIESVLSSHPDVREAAIVARRNPAGENTLIAYVVATERFNVSTLRQYISEKLPAYMTPSAFINLQALPLTPNGKLNQAALPALEEYGANPTKHYAAPRSSTEEALAQVWKNVLALDQIGIHDNFFELGGHSLIAVRLFASMGKKFGKHLSLATLFQAPTIAQLAALLEENGAREWSSLVPIQTQGTRPPFFCVHAVGGNVLEYYDLARCLGPDQPFYAFQSRGLDGAAAPHSRIEDMAAHYVKELREFQPAGPYFIGGRSLGGTIAFEMARQLKAQGQEVGIVALLDSYPVGHLKLAPHGDSANSKTRRFFKRVNAHLENLRGLRLREKADYVADKAQYAPLRIQSKLWRTVYRSYQSVGYEVPPALRDVEEFNWMAAHDYTPHVYHGRITLFWASQDLRAKFDLLEGWLVLARGGMEVHEVPGTHLDMIKEPHVAELAKKLDACLAKAQGRNSRQNQSAALPLPVENRPADKNRAA